MDGKVVSENVSLFWPVTLGQTYGDNNEYHFTYLRLTLKDLTEGVHEVTSIQVPGAKDKFVFPLHWSLKFVSLRRRNPVLTTLPIPALYSSTTH